MKKYIKINTKKSISILSPAHQNEKYITEFIISLFKDVVRPLRSRNIICEVIIGEDGSTDKTREILIKLNKKYKFKLVLGTTKLGYVKAAKQLFDMAKGDMIFFLDSDGEISPKSFWKLLKKFEKGDYDLINAYKKNRKPFYRFVISKINNFILKVLFNLNIKDANAGFKLYSKNAIKKIIKKCGSLKYNFNSEQVIVATKLDYKIGEVGVRHYERESVVFKPTKLIFLLVLAFKELINYRKTFYKTIK